MSIRLTPEELQNNKEFELLAEVSHQKLREFVVEQIREEKVIIRIYSIYQVVMMIIFVFLLTRSIIFAFKGYSEPIIGIGLALLFSFTILIVFHELLHALAYLISGARKISFGYIWNKFVFYALADRQVIASKAFHFVALTPLVVVKLISLAGAIVFFNNQWMYFFLTVMCTHSLFCAGDMAMLSFYNLHREKEIYNFDNRSEGKTYFYMRNKLTPKP
jgi:hypothetical protein